MSFPRTKIQLPRPRSTYVERGVVQQRLVEALSSRRLALLCAPAGYGKTMLLAHAVAALDPAYAVAWISADEGDDLQRLLQCMFAALEPFDPPWRTAPEALLSRVGRPTAHDERAIAAEIINTLDACEVVHGIIAFDDVHRIDDPNFFRFLNMLIERMSPRWTFALTSRTDPPLSLARLRAADELVELRQLQLQFARDDARQMLAAAGVDAAIADRVFDRTHGWPAGLRIAIGAIAGGPAGAPDAIERAMRAGDRPMFDLLTSEVLGDLRPELAEFLLRVSVLPELEAARCATVADEPAAAALLDEIERLGLFVDVLEAPMRTLRLHDLLRDALQQRLAFERPQLFAELRGRAAATESDPVRRIGMLIAANSYEAAADLVFEHVPSLVATVGAATAHHLIGQFPATFRDRSPDLEFVRGHCGWVDWNFASMLECFERAEHGYVASGNEERALLARAYRATILLARFRLDEGAALLESLDNAKLPATTRIVVLNAKSWLAVETGRLRAAAPLRSEMLDLLERVDRIDLWWHTSPPNRIPGLPGMLKPLMRYAEALLRVASDQPTPLRSVGLLLQGWCALWQGRFADARALRDRAVEHGQWAGETSAVRSQVLTLTAFLQAASGDAAAAVATAHARVRALQSSYDGLGLYALLLVAARMASVSSDAHALQGFIDQLDAIEASNRDVDFTDRRRPKPPLLAHLAWLEGDAEQAIALWHDALAHEEAIDVFGHAAETRVRLARALAARGDVEAAARVLVPMFERAEADAAPGGALFAFDALRELAAVEWRGALVPKYRNQLSEWVRLLASERSAEIASSTLPSMRGAHVSKADGLTTRELDVLRRIASGDSNKLIARALDLSLHTVKRHVANILGKLGAETRGQAAAWYRSRG